MRWSIKAAFLSPVQSPGEILALPLDLLGAVWADGILVFVRGVVGGVGDGGGESDEDRLTCSN